MANLIIVTGRGQGSHTSAFGRKWEWLEPFRDHYARVISDRKWPLKKRPVIAHIKTRSKHSFLTINRKNYTLSSNNNLDPGFASTWGHNFYMGTQNGPKLEI